MDAPKSYFPIVGQLIEPGRSFYPGVNGIEVQAVFNQEEIAFLLSWHDMTAEQGGANHPGLSVPLFDPMATDTTMGAIFRRGSALAAGGDTGRLGKALLHAWRWQKSHEHLVCRPCYRYSLSAYGEWFGEHHRHG